MGAPRIALDAMGGDHAPQAVVAGAVRAHRDEGIEVALVGDPAAIGAALREIDADGDLKTIAAAETVGMAEDPAIAVRGKPDSSIRVAARLVATGDADALVSAGSTGATLAAALLELGRVPGVRRPVVAVALPMADREIVLVDAGGSADVQPDALPAYARMGVAYAEVRGSDRPRVGLLNVGTEPGKGNALVREAFDLMHGRQGFVGNVEPDRVVAGDVDVVVTDGFTGNIFLKTVEALVGEGGAAEHGGAAVLLGVAGEVLVAHGSSQEAEIAAALSTAATVAAARLSDRIAERLRDG